MEVEMNRSVGHHRAPPANGRDLRLLIAG